MVKYRGLHFLKSHKPLNNKGMGLIEIVISMGLMGIMAMAFTNMISQSNKSTRELEEKVALLQFEKDLISVTTGINICEKVFSANPANFRFASTLFPPPAATEVNLVGLYLDPAGTLSFAVAGSKINASSQIKVDRIAIRNIRGSAPNFIANLDIKFREGYVPRRPVSTQVRLNTTDDGSMVTLTGCEVRSASSGGPGGPVDTQVVCENLGGAWIDPGSPRPAFCTFDSDSMSWF